MGPFSKSLMAVFCLVVGAFTTILAGQEISKEAHLKLAAEAELRFHAAIDAWAQAAARKEDTSSIEAQIDANFSAYVGHLLDAGGIPNAAHFGPEQFAFAGPVTAADGTTYSVYMGGGATGVGGWVWRRAQPLDVRSHNGGFCFSAILLPEDRARGALVVGRATVERADKQTTFYIPYTLRNHIGILVVRFDGKTWRLTPDVGYVDAGYGWHFDGTPGDPATRPGTTRSAATSQAAVETDVATIKAVLLQDSWKRSLGAFGHRDDYSYKFSPDGKVVGTYRSDYVSVRMGSWTLSADTKGRAHLEIADTEHAGSRFEGPVAYDPARDLIVISKSPTVEEFVLSRDTSGRRAATAPATTREAAGTINPSATTQAAVKTDLATIKAVLMQDQWVATTGYGNFTEEHIYRFRSAATADLTIKSRDNVSTSCIWQLVEDSSGRVHLKVGRGGGALATVGDAVVEFDSNADKILLSAAQFAGKMMLSRRQTKAAGEAISPTAPSTQAPSTGLPGTGDASVPKH